MSPQQQPPVDPFSDPEFQRGMHAARAMFAEMHADNERVPALYVRLAS